MNSLPFRIKIGVTGHRKGIATDALKNRLRQILDLSSLSAEHATSNNSLLSICGSSTVEVFRRLKETPLSYCIYTALAEGADRIVADVVLETDKAVMRAVLPLVEEEYEEDFLTKESIDEFRQLLQADPNPIRMRPERLPKVGLPDQIIEERRNAYYDAGQYIVDECDVLIAVWDGMPSKGRGGTQDIIEYARSVHCPVILINSEHANLMNMEGQLNFSPNMLMEIDHFNHFHPEEKVLHQFTDELEAEYFDVKKFPEVTDVDNIRQSELRAHVFESYAKASILARGFKKKYMNVGLLIYVFSTLAVAIVLLSVIFEILHMWAFVIEFLLLGILYYSIRLAREAKVHARWLGYRFLAERIRTTSYFFLSGFRFEDHVHLKTDEFTSRNDATAVLFEEIWMPVNRLHHTEKNNTMPRDANPVIVAYVRKSFIEEQLHFQERYSKKHHKKNEKLEKAGGLLFFFAMLAAILHILLHTEPSWIPGMEWINKSLTFLALIFPTVAAAIEGVRHKNEYARNTHRSKMMMEDLQELIKEYHRVRTNDEFYHILKKSASLILNDNEDWRNLMRERDLEIVV